MELVFFSPGKYRLGKNMIDTFDLSHFLRKATFAKRNRLKDCLIGTEKLEGKTLRQ